MGVWRNSPCKYEFRACLCGGQTATATAPSDIGSLAGWSLCQENSSLGRVKLAVMQGPRVLWTRHTVAERDASVKNALHGLATGGAFFTPPSLDTAPRQSEAAPASAHENSAYVFPYVAMAFVSIRLRPRRSARNFLRQSEPLCSDYVIVKGAKRGPNRDRNLPVALAFVALRLTCCGNCAGFSLYACVCKICAKFTVQRPMNLQCRSAPLNFAASASC